MTDFRSWARHNQTLFEMSLAAPVVIAHRSARLMAAGAQPSPADQREFSRMAQEKIDAWAESWTAMAWAGWRAQQAAGLAMWRRWWTGYTEPQHWMKASALNPLQASAAWQARSWRTWSSVVGSGLAPVHRRVTANARRLTSRSSLPVPLPKR